MRSVGMMSLLLAACGSGEVHYTRGVPEESEADADTDADADGDADADADTDTSEYEIAIGGTWVDSLGIGNLVTDETWTWHYAGYPDTVFEITQFENDPGFAIVHDAEGDQLWGRFDWTWRGDVPYICHATESVADEGAAVSAPAPDRDDLTSGCGGFEWWQLTPT